MSSITKATARSVSTIRNASAWSLAGMMVMPRLLGGIGLGELLDVGGAEVETTVLPLRSSIMSSLLDFFET